MRQPLWGVSPCQTRLRWHVSQWVKQNGRTHSLWYHPRGDTCCHLLWQISNRTGCFYRWLHFITGWIHADWRSCCLCMCSVFTAHLLVCKTPPPPQTNSKWSTTHIKRLSFKTATPASQRSWNKFNEKIEKCSSMWKHLHYYIHNDQNHDYITGHCHKVK